MKKVLKNSFFNRKTEVVAKELLGTFLVRKMGGKETAWMITETEAYIGPQDLASHSSRGRTKRNEPMFAEPGTIYVYFTYGMHWMLNIVTEEKDYPAAVLIRGTDQVTGPARLTKALKINKTLNGKKLGKETGLWIEENYKPRRKAGDPTKSSALKILRLPRVGVSYAGEIWANKKLRFVLTN